MGNENINKISYFIGAGILAFSGIYLHLREEKNLRREETERNFGVANNVKYDHEVRVRIIRYKDADFKERLDE